MQTIVLETPGELRLIDTDAPRRPGPGEALVQVRRIGVCGTDQHAYRGRQPFFNYPRILGHELGVVIEEIGTNDRGLRSGDRCAVEPYLNCGMCVACRAGKSNCCVTLKCLGVHTDGGMRERIVLPIEKLHKSESLSLDQLALVETLGIGAHAVQRAAVQPGENALVVGAGPIGLTVALFARLAGARVIVLDVREDRLEFCRRELKVDETLFSGDDTVERLRALTQSDLPTAVFDATGNAGSMQSAFGYCAHGGRLTLVGLVQDQIAFHDPEFHRRELTLLASRNSTAQEFHRIIALMEAGKIDTRGWITHRANFAEAITAFQTWLDPAQGVIKAMVEAPSGAE